MRRHARSPAIGLLILTLAATACASSEATGGTASTTSANVSSPDTTVADTSTSTVLASNVPTSNVPTSNAPSSTVPSSLPIAEVEPAARLDPVVMAGLDADGFAARLSASHAVMVDPSAAPVDRARAGVDHQLVLRELADRPDLDEAVLELLAAPARASVERVVRARQFLQARSAARPPQPLPDVLPAWTIVEPESVDSLRSYYDEAEQLTGIAWYWLAAINLQETRMGRIRGVSSAGAVGPMQFLPSTWEVCCAGDPTATRDAIIGAATYLAQSGGPGDMAAAMYQYNPNDGYVALVTAYAESLRDEPELYSGYHAFQVFYGTSAGTVRLPVGYAEPAPIDAATYIAEHPSDAA